MPPCLTLSIIRYVLRVKWSNPGKEIAPSPTLLCSSSWKGTQWVAPDYLIYLSGGVFANVVECNIVVNEFEIQLLYHAYFQTNTLGRGMNPLNPHSYGLNITADIRENWF